MSQLVSRIFKDVSAVFVDTKEIMICAFGPRKTLNGRLPFVPRPGKFPFLLVDIHEFW